MITCHHNPTLQDIRRLSAQARPTARFVAEGEDLLAAADAAGWQPLVRLRAGEDVTAEALAKVSALGSGTRELAIYEERWGVPTGPLCVALWGVRDPGNVGTVLRGALAFGAGVGGHRPRTRPTPTAPRRSAPRWARSSPCRSRASTSVGELPAPAIALAAREGEPLAPGRRRHAGHRRRARPGCRADVVAGCDRVRHIPIRSESLNAAMAATIALYEVRPRA